MDTPSSELLRQESAAAEHALFEARLRQREIELLEKQAVLEVAKKQTLQEQDESMHKKEEMSDAGAGALKAASVQAAAMDRSRRPWSNLYSDALHSILRFMSLSDLSHLMCVDRRCLSTVLTMPSRQLAHRMGSMFVACHFMQTRMASRIARHVGSFGERQVPSIGFLHCLPARMPWISELHLTPTEQWSLIMCAESISALRSLRHLDLNLRIAWKLCEVKNTIIAAVGCLRKLETLTLHLPLSMADVSFAPLVYLPSLRTFTLQLETYDLLMTSTQIAELRAMSSVTSLTLLSPCKPDRVSAFFARMLHPGHALAWTTFPGWCVRITDPLSLVLGSLSSSLQSLEVYLECTDVRFFSQLPSLTSVILHRPAPGLDLDDFIQSISQCTQLRTLGLSSFGLSCDQMERLLASFPLLSIARLTQLDGLASLRCFAIPALAGSLTHLSLASLPACPSSEVSHLLGLRSLQELWISRMKTWMGAEEQQLFSVRSARFPRLVKRSCT